VSRGFGAGGVDPVARAVGAANRAGSVVVVPAGNDGPTGRTPGSVGNVAVMGGATAVLMLFSWRGLALLDPTFASFLWRFTPVVVIVLGAAVLGERLRAVEIGALALMVLGGVLSTIGRWQVVGLGTVFTLIGCGAGAVQLLFAKKQTGKVHPNVLAFYRVGIGAVLIALWTFGTGRADFHVPGRFWAVTLIGAFLGPCFSYLLTFRSYRYWDLSQASIVRTMQPLIALPMTYAAFRTLPVRQELLGGSLILVGALWIAWIHFGGRKPA